MLLFTEAMASSIVVDFRSLFKNIFRSSLRMFAYLRFNCSNVGACLMKDGMFVSLEAKYRSSEATCRSSEAK